jgi:type III secretory pathway component EscR
MSKQNIDKKTNSKLMKNTKTIEKLPNEKVEEYQQFLRKYTNCFEKSLYHLFWIILV